MDNLLIAVMGARNSGKSFTWNKLFDNKVITGKNIRRLYLNESEYTEVFLISGSPQEREKNVSDIIKNCNPKIVLCSMQYIEGVKASIDFFVEHKFQIYCQWLNPGFNDANSEATFDFNGTFNYLIGLGATVVMKNAKIDVIERVQEMSEYIYGWAKYKNLIFKES
jgi:hypothetical protein